MYGRPRVKGNGWKVPVIVGRSTTTLGLKSSLVAAWELGEASGDRADSHSGGFTLTDNNTVASDTGIGGTGVAAKFNSAASEHLSYATPASLVQAGAYSLSLHFYIDDLSANRGLLHALTNTNGATGNYALTWHQATGSLRLAVYTSAFNQYTHVVALSINTWYHLAVTWNATTLKAYLNGSEIALTDDGSAGGGYGTGFSLGRWYNAADYLLGRLQYVRIFSTALTAGNVTSLYNGGAGVAYAAL